MIILLSCTITVSSSPVDDTFSSGSGSGSSKLYIGEKFRSVRIFILFLCLTGGQRHLLFCAHLRRPSGEHQRRALEGGQESTRIPQPLALCQPPGAPTNWTLSC